MLNVSHYAFSYPLFRNGLGLVKIIKMFCFHDGVLSCKTIFENCWMFKKKSCYVDLVLPFFFQFFSFFFNSFLFFSVIQLFLCPEALYSNFH